MEQEAFGGELAVSRVFISSASGPLAVYRHAAVEVCHRLHLTPVHMEEFDPQRPTPAQVCQQEVQRCDVFVLLLAHRYGARPPGSQLSYTELEYRWAVGRTELPLLAFVVDPGFPWQPLDIDHGADAEALSQFVARVKSQHEVKPLTDVGAFREDLLIALSRLSYAPSVGSAEKKKQARATPRPMAPMFRAVPFYVEGAPFTGRAADLARLDDWGRSADPVMVVEAIGGAGKSALTWQWVNDRASAVIDGLSGRLWWSFYEGSASMTRFLHEFLGYVSGRPVEEILPIPPNDLADEVLTALRACPYLVVLDGFERLLAAYHRLNPSKMQDEEAEAGKRALIEANADDIVRKLAAAGPSKILISTRLRPLALESRFGQQMPGVQYLQLPGLIDSDTRTLLGRLGVRGSEAAIARFFGPLGNHPLLVGVVAGLVRDYRIAPGDLARWLADPTAGGALSVPSLDLTHRRTHILAAALSGLEPGSRRLLGWISAFDGSVTWDTLTAVNPFQPERFTSGERVLNPSGISPHPISDSFTRYGRSEEAQHEPLERLSAGRSLESLLVTAQLDASLKDLEDRGLVQWDRSSNSYGMHPIIHAYAFDQLQGTERIQAFDRIRDHFQALPPEDPTQASSVEDIAQTVTIFRALVGAQHYDQAKLLWSRFGGVLVDLGAHATIIELLGSHAAVTLGSPMMQGDLAMAYGFSGMYDEAINQYVKSLADALKAQDDRNSIRCLLQIGLYFRESGGYLAAMRCLELGEAISAARLSEIDGGQCLLRAIQIALQGMVDQARELLSRAAELGPPSGFPWFRDAVEYWRLYLALVTDQALTQAQLSDAATQVRSWRFRRELAALCYEFFVQCGNFDRALAAALEHERLSRNAGIEAVPAASAFVLAKLGRTGEASAAVEESLACFPRIHPAQRPDIDLARALWELGRQSEAASCARAAYREAWHDGPPYCNPWELGIARQLLWAMDEPIPNLPTLDHATVKVPLEDKVRTFIVRLQARGRRSR